MSALACSTPVLAAGAAPEKVDKALAGKLRSGAVQQIIVTAQRGSRRAVRQALEGRGRRIRAEYESLDMLALELPSDEVLALVKSKHVKAVSLDGPVAVQQFSSELSSSTLPVFTTTLRRTLGLPSTASSTMNGSGVGVALIDSEPRR